MIRTDTEARQRIVMPFDLDFMTEKFKTKNLLYTFSSPSIWTLEKHLFYLLKNSISVDLESKYYKKPWLLSYDQYGTVILEYLLLYVNGVFCAEDFTIATVVLPTIDSIIEICSDNVPTPDVDSLESVEW